MLLELLGQRLDDPVVRMAGVEVDLFRPDEELKRLARLAVDTGITGAFKHIWETSEQHRISLRTAAFVVACTRVLQAREERGLYP